MADRVIIINGPNLNMLGKREPEIYGNETLDQIEKNCMIWAHDLGLEVDFRQSNDEGQLVDWIQQSSSDYCAIIINAGAYTHTSIAIHDALKGSDLNIIEVHLSNIFKREAFRHVSYVSTLAMGIISGFGSQGYKYALEAVANFRTT